MLVLNQEGTTRNHVYSQGNWGSQSDQHDSSILLEEPRPCIKELIETKKDGILLVC